MVFWGAEVKPGAHCTPSGDDDSEFMGSRLHLSQATLGLDGKGKERTVVKCKVGDGPELLLCSLTPGVSESCSLDLLFDQDVVFSVAGSTSVHLVGYYMPLDDEEEDNDYEMEGSEFDSDDDSDDVDYEDSDMDDMEDLEAPPSSVMIIELDEEGNLATLEDAAVKKREAGSDSDEEDPKSSKKRKRAAAAKEKAVAAKEKKKEAQQKLDKVTVQEASEDEDGFPLSPEKTEAVNGSDRITTVSSESKKQKKKSKKEKVAEQVEEEEKPSNKAGKTPSKAEKTPGKAEKTPGKAEKTPGKAEKTPCKAEKTPGKSEKTPGKAEKTPNKAAKENGSEGTTLTMTAAINGSPVTVGTPASAKKAKKAGSSIRKFPNGLEIEELAMGRPDARQTKPGKKVSVHYTGKLKSNGKIFDSSRGKKPFAFRLGVGEVVKGWDVGVAGMRIGDKRKITIPPAMGYGAKGTGPIPGNAWLVFDVELVDVAK